MLDFVQVDFVVLLLIEVQDGGYDFQDLILIFVEVVVGSYEANDKIFYESLVHPAISLAGELFVFCF